MTKKIKKEVFPRVSKMFLVLQENSLYFPCLEKLRMKFPVFPVLISDHER